ncbi:MAG TPA: hypothetical protein VN939_00240 [Chthoniobacterales bacterium]|nr:hypothetical protein [Chthoniobacterales bacterium]
MTTDRLASLNVAVVDDDLTLCDTRSALLKPPGGTVILRENGGSLAYAPVSLIPKPLLLLNRGTAFRYNLITFVQAD